MVHTRPTFDRMTSPKAKRQEHTWCHVHTSHSYYYKIAEHSLTRKLVYLQKIVASQPTPTYITTWYRSGAHAIYAAWTTLHTWLAHIHFLYLRFMGHAWVNTPRLCDHGDHRMVDVYLSVGATLHKCKTFYTSYIAIWRPPLAIEPRAARWSATSTIWPLGSKSGRSYLLTWA